MPYIIIYKDADLKQAITEIKTDEPVLAGQTYETTFYVKNISNFELLDILFIASDSDVSFNPRVIQHMNPNEVIAVKTVWKPTLTRMTPLNAQISADFRVIVRNPSDHKHKS
jgi:predicted metal-dependent RNase